MIVQGDAQASSPSLDALYREVFDDTASPANDPLTTASNAFTSNADLATNPPTNLLAEPATDTRPSAKRSMPFEPGLEGLRGLALIAVLVFHAGFRWAVGGFLGVSTFFTLSGFLITTLLVSEHRRSGRIGLSGFWSRRFRRLMPAALTCLAVVVVMGATIADPSQLARLRGDVIAALAYVANWHFIATGQTYGELFTAPSLVLQFWSLAIEEQFYLVFPIVVVIVLKITHGSHRLLAMVFGIAITMSLLASVLLYDPADTSRVYFGTGTRAAELLVGALLALALAKPAVRSWLKGRAMSVVVAALGLVGLFVVVLCWHRVHQQDAWLYHGGFIAYSLVSVSLILGAMHFGPLRAILSSQPLRLAGVVSYGAYLYHWPIYLWLTPERTGLALWPLFGLRMVVTFAAATLSYQLLEKRILTGRVIRGWAPYFVVPAAISMVVICLVFVTVNVGPPPGTMDLAVRSGLLSSPTVAANPIATGGLAKNDLNRYLIAPGKLGVGEVAAGATPRVTAPPPRMALLLGDSLSWSIASGLKNSLTDHGGTGLVSNSLIACPIWTGAELRNLNENRKLTADCLGRPAAITADLNEYHPGLVIVLSCLADVSDRKLPGESIWRSPGDPVYDAAETAAITATVDQLSAGGAQVAWLTCPALDPQYHMGLNMRPGPYAEAEPERVAVLNSIIRKVAESRPQNVGY